MLQIMTADQRLQKRNKVNICMLGPYGIGKTFQARTLPADRTLFLDLEAGMLAVEGDVKLADGTVMPSWAGDSINIMDIAQQMKCHPWKLARAIVCIIRGPDPAAPQDDPYSQYWYNYYINNIFSPDMFDKYDYVFIDSATVASRMSLSWAKQQPEAINEKGNKDNWAIYGLNDQELVKWFTTIQHIDSKNVILSALLTQTKDKFDKPVNDIQMEGSKAGNELPGIFDQVITLGMFSHDAQSNIITYDPDRGTERAFVCHKNNGFGVPAKDRSGSLEMLEPPNLKDLIDKSLSQAVRAGNANLQMPQYQEVQDGTVPPSAVEQPAQTMAQQPIQQHNNQ